MDRLAGFSEASLLLNGLLILEGRPLVIKFIFTVLLSLIPFYEPTQANTVQ
jgi:hypothetical protein